MKLFLTNLVVLILFLSLGCKPQIDIPRPNAGKADFSQYIAIGNSLTAGYADGGLYLEGQKVAFPNLLAEQMKLAKGGEFNSPFFDASQSNGSGYLNLKAFLNGSPVMETISTNLAYRDEKFLSKYMDPIQNLGIPGMRLDLAFYPAFSAMNIFFERLLPQEEVGSKSYFSYAIEHEHSFFSLWLGNNDVLGYATAGGYSTAENAATTQLTEKAVFANLYGKFLDGLTLKDQKGIVATIPDVTDIPYFRTLTIESLLQGAKAAAPDQSATINAIYIQDKTALVPGFPMGVREANKFDLVVLAFLTEQQLGKPDSQGHPYGLHPANPIHDRFILDEKEVMRVKEHVASYNQAIVSLAESKGLAIADMQAYFNQVKQGINVNGATVNAAFITGGLFSLDGIHLTPKGNAMITNLFIREINVRYESKLSEIDVNRYRSVKFP